MLVEEEVVAKLPVELVEPGVEGPEKLEPRVLVPLEQMVLEVEVEGRMMH
jgi:hypothetical protein